MIENEIALKNSLKILVVDDETGMTPFLEKALIAAGHAPTVVYDPIDALFEFKHNAENYDILITDQLMSRMTGVQLTQEFLKINPDFPVLIYAGWNDHLRSEADLPAGNVSLIKRPAPMSEVITFLETVKPQNLAQPESKTENVFCLIYVSKAADNFSESDLIQILNSSRQNNEKAGITGVFLSHNGCFLQLLEGDFNAINELFYKRIFLDKRHHSLITIFQEYKEKRDFPNWNMGFYSYKDENTSDTDTNLLANCTDLNLHPTAKFFKEQFQTAQKLFENFQFRNDKKQLNHSKNNEHENSC